VVVLVGVLCVAIVARFVVFPLVAVSAAMWVRVALAVTLAAALVAVGFVVLVYGGFALAGRLR
jgi:hypothetical protein